jgi:hypothetical protein
MKIDIIHEGKSIPPEGKPLPIQIVEALSARGLDVRTYSIQTRDDIIHHQANAIETLQHQAARAKLYELEIAKDLHAAQRALAEVREDNTLLRYRSERLQRENDRLRQALKGNVVSG